MSDTQDYYSQENIVKHIAAFKKRIEEDPEYCQELFDHATVRLLCFKYAYYVLNETIVKDVTYDLEEKGWYVMGRALGYLAEDQTSPCIDFDSKHPKAPEGIELAKYFLKIVD